MTLSVEQYTQTSVYDLLAAAGRGQVGIDHRWLHAIVDRGPGVVPDLLRFASDDHEEDPVNLEEEVIGILRYLKAPEALPFFVECIRRQPSEVSDELVEAMHEIGQPAVEPLLALYNDLGEDNAGDLAFLLASLRVHDPRVLKVLLDRLDYDLADGALCLGLYGDPAAKPALEKALSDLDPKDKELSSLRHEVRTALDQIDEPGQDDHMVPPFDLWSLYPEVSAPDLDLLSESERLSFLQSTDPTTRAEAAASFFNRELTAEQRTVLFTAAKNDSDPTVRARAWESLGSDTDQPEIRDALLQVIGNTDAPLEERAGALVGLAVEMDEPAVFEHTLALYELPEARGKALEAMWRSMDRRFQEHFPKHLEDSDKDVQRQAIWGVGYLGLVTESGRLQKLFEHEELRADALFAYALAAPGDISRSRIKPFLRKIDQLAGGLSEGETELVQVALDERLALHGLEPVFFPDQAKEEAELAEARTGGKTGRNDPCPCGSGKKYKKCCGA